MSKDPEAAAREILPPDVTLIARLCRWLPPLIALRLREQVYPIQRRTQSPFKYRIRSRTGSYFSGESQSLSGFVFAFHGYNNWRNWAIVVSVVQPGDHIVEAGAHIGTETVGYSDLVGATGRVHAFEPLSTNRAQLEAAVAQFQFQNVTVRPYALSDREQQLAFTVPEPSASGAAHSTSAATTAPTETVACVTLDSLLGEDIPITALILDAEGSEPAILRGAHTLIETQKPFIVVEAIPKLLKWQGLKLADLYAVLAEHNYAVYHIRRFGLRALTAADLRAGDWFAAHRDRLDSAAVVDRMLKRCGIMPMLRGLNPLKRW